MSVKKYETFLKTVDLGSLTKASEVLGYTQSAISHIITGLEDELGLKLLIRDRTGVRLTEEGKRVVPSIRAVCQTNQEVFRQVAEIHGLEVGVIRIGTFLSVSVHLLPDLIHAFSEKHPHIEFELLQGSYGDIEQWIREDRIDFGFLRLPANPNFESALLVEERILAIFPQTRKLTARRFPVEQIKEEAYIMRPDGLELEMREILKETVYRPKITYSAKDDYAVMAMVERGLGMSILPELLLKRTPYKLVKKELDPPARRKIGIAYKSLQGLSPAARQFVQYVKASFAHPTGSEAPSTGK